MPHDIEPTLRLLDATPFTRAYVRSSMRIEAYRCDVPGGGVLTVLRGSAGIQAALVWPNAIVDFDDTDAQALWEIARHQANGILPKAAA